jgi:hypothetical protein
MLNKTSVFDFLFKNDQYNDASIKKNINHFKNNILKINHVKKTFKKLNFFYNNVENTKIIQIYQEYIFFTIFKFFKNL